MTTERFGAIHEIVSRVLTLGAVFIPLPEVSADGSLPTEFRIFHAGRNTTRKGDVVFDEAAAKAVMLAYETHGVDLMIDLEHASLDPAAQAMRDDARDARGWMRLTVRPGPELWAVDVTWTEDGADRLRKRKQRYISPVVRVGDDDRASAIMNVALTSMPATDDAPALVASLGCASKKVRKLGMSPETVQSVVDAIEAGDSAKALEILKTLLVEAASGKAAEVEPTPEPTEGSGDPPPPEMLSLLSDVREMREQFRLLSEESKALRAEADALRAARLTAEDAERADLVGTLVKLSAEVPATAWQDADKRVPVKRLRDEPIASLRGRVAALSALQSTGAGAGLTPDGKLLALSELERDSYNRLPTPEAKDRFLRMITRRNGEKGTK